MIALCLSYAIIRTTICRELYHVLPLFSFSFCLFVSYVVPHKFATIATKPSP